MSMKFAMSLTVPVGLNQLWRTLVDVERISRCIPGCEEVEEIERLARYKALIKQKVGPFRVKVPAEITVESLVEPRSVHTCATGKDEITGTLVAISLSVRLDSIAHETSRIEVDANMEMQGRLVSLGFPIIKRQAEKNFAEFERRLTETLGHV